jgi:hypothetical protein
MVVGHSPKVRNRRTAFATEVNDQEPSSGTRTLAGSGRPPRPAWWQLWPLGPNPRCAMDSTKSAAWAHEMFGTVSGERQQSGTGKAPGATPDRSSPELPFRSGASPAVHRQRLEMMRAGIASTWLLHPARAEDPGLRVRGGETKTFIYDRTVMKWLHVGADDNESSSCGGRLAPARGIAARICVVTISDRFVMPLNDYCPSRVGLTHRVLLTRTSSLLSFSPLPC